ncbi:MAG: carboxypeptidase-like regulatory domain-containing protein [Chthoniobacterales bacterium]
MKSLSHSLAGLFFLGAILFGATAATAQTAPVSLVEGYVYRSSGQPVPGVTVSLVHPAVGRSSPAITNPGGYYYFSNVPMRADPYYIEVYWGTQLLYRNTFLANAPRVSLATIVLP